MHTHAPIKMQIQAACGLANDHDMYLIEPVQRVCRYPLLLDKMIREKCLDELMMFISTSVKLIPRSKTWFLTVGYSKHFGKRIKQSKLGTYWTAGEIANSREKRHRVDQRTSEYCWTQSRSKRRIGCQKNRYINLIGHLNIQWGEDCNKKGA